MKWVIVLFSVVFLTVCLGCSIQKRHYNGGYYIQWHKRYHADEGKRAKQNVNDTLAEKKDVDSTVAAIDSTLVPPIELVPDVKDETIGKHDQLPPLPKEERKFEPLGVLAFKLLLSEIPVGLWLDHTSMNHLRTESWLGLLFLTILLISLVLAVVSMIRYLRNPKHYRFNIWAILVILVAVFFLVQLILGNWAFTIKFNALF